VQTQGQAQGQGRRSEYVPGDENDYAMDDFEKESLILSARTLGSPDMAASNRKPDLSRTKKELIGDHSDGRQLSQQQRYALSSAAGSAINEKPKEVAFKTIPNPSPATAPVPEIDPLALIKQRWSQASVADMMSAATSKVNSAAASVASAADLNTRNDVVSPITDRSPRSDTTGGDDQDSTKKKVKTKADCNILMIPYRALNITLIKIRLD
jgi:hypothetical protein